MSYIYYNTNKEKSLHFREEERLRSASGNEVGSKAREACLLRALWEDFSFFACYNVMAIFAFHREGIHEFYL